MIYLDYAANTPVREEVLTTFCEVSRAYSANPNSHHTLGRQAGEKLTACTRHMLTLLAATDREMIYTSGATEANNLAIKGAAHQYRGRGKHILTTYLEHSSVHGAIGALQAEGYEVEYVDLLPNGQVDITHLQSLLRQDTVLVSVCYVDSELGIIQDIDSIGRLLSSHPNCLFHVDVTQAAGKFPLALAHADLVCFAPHKFYGLNGIGALIKKPEVLLETQIHGGASTTQYRSGSPALALIASMDTALSLAYADMEANNRYVQALNARLRQVLGQYPDVAMNSPQGASAYLLNVSVPGRDASAILQALEQKGFCLSGKSACTAPKAVSRPVYALTKSRRLALSTLRISISHLTTAADIEGFLAAFDVCYQESGR